MRSEEVRVGGTALDGSGVERHVWAVILDRVYYYERQGNAAPWRFDRHARPLSVEEFARRHK